MKKRAVFLDLNGTIVLPLKQNSLTEMTLIPGADTAIRKLTQAGFLCPIITVQARIEKGLFTEGEFRHWFTKFFDTHSLDVNGPYICPHRYNYHCACEKPNTLLYENAASDLSIDLSQSFTIGDSPQDVEAARRFGGIGCFVKTGWFTHNPNFDDRQVTADFIGDSIVDATEWIINNAS